MSVVTMMCMTTKQKFDVTEPEVTVLANGRYAYKAKCPWQGKNGRDLHAFKFCSLAAYQAYTARVDANEDKHAKQDELDDKQDV